MASEKKLLVHSMSDWMQNKAPCQAAGHRMAGGEFAGTVPHKIPTVHKKLSDDKHLNG